MTENRIKDRASFLLAVFLIVGAVVLAAVSWQLPSRFYAPMTADMRGAVEVVEPAYEHTRMAIRLEGNVTRFTMMLPEFEALPQKPQVGDKVGIKYDINSDRLIRKLIIEDASGADVVVYQTPNPIAKERQKWQYVAFAVYGLYALACVGVYTKKTKKQK